MRILLHVAIVALILAVAVEGTEPAKVELHLLETMTVSDEQFLAGTPGKPSTIAAELRIPSSGTNRLPAMVIVHGSGGIGGEVDRWSRELNDLGVATLVLDGFTARGITSVVGDQSQLGSLTMINDAYRGLELLAKHPRIDSARIGIMGGSRGGRVALYASLKRFQKMYGPADARFAVYLPFYAPCYTTFVDDTEVDDRPIRLFHGADDDYVPVASCRAYVERLRRAGKDVRLTEYAGAHHLFDNPVFPLRTVPQGQTARRCALEERTGGRVVDRDTGRPFEWTDPCVERGVTVGYNAAAHSSAVRDVSAVLRSIFGLM